MTCLEHKRTWKGGEEEERKGGHKEDWGKGEEKEEKVERERERKAGGRERGCEGEWKKMPFSPLSSPVLQERRGKKKRKV